jgi:hypothetical protein
VKSVVDVRAERVEGDATVGIAFGASHLGAAQPSRYLHLHALGARAHRAGQRALHGSAKGDPVLQLLRDRLSDEARVEFGALDLQDVDLDLLAGDPMQVSA